MLSTPMYIKGYREVFIISHAGRERRKNNRSVVQLCRGPAKAQSGRNAVDGGPCPSRLGNGGRVCVHGQRLLDQPRTHAGAGFLLQACRVMGIFDATFFCLIWSKLCFTSWLN